MRKMYVVITGIFLLCVSAVQAQTANNIKSKVIGKWDVSITEAPEEYQKLTITFRLNEGKVLMDVKGESLDIKNQELAEKEGKLSITLYVEGEVKILIWDEKEEIKGSAETPMGLLSLKFKKSQ